MSKIRTTKVYVIRESVTGDLIKFGSKCGWCSKGAAKNAFNLHMTSYYDKGWSEGARLFDTQDQFIIEEIV